MCTPCKYRAESGEQANPDGCVGGGGQKCYADTRLKMPPGLPSFDDVRPKMLPSTLASDGHAAEEPICARPK
jgi:hypothetical protein